MRVPFKVGSIFIFDDKMIGSLTSHGKLAMVSPSGMTLHPSKHPKLADYMQRHLIDTMIEPDEDIGTVYIDDGIAERRAA